MKILIINLLRIGDCIMSVPVINGLKAARNDAQIDMLTFKPVASLQPMLPAVTKWWTLDREELQAGLGEAEIPLLTSFAILQERLDAINAHEYDLIVNLSQTNFSAWIAGYLKSSDRLGLTYDVKGLPHFYSPWFRYLNDQPESTDDIFHYTDIFLQACGLSSSSMSMQKTPKGEDEVKALGLSSEPLCALQLYTSDIKKNWSEDNWLHVVQGLKEMQLVALGAPSEEARLDAFITRAAEKGVTIKKAIVSLEGALSVLDRAEILITGDTSIKHLANAARTKVIELCLGPSDWRRTGAYKSDALIVQGDVAPDSLVKAVHAIVADDWKAIASLDTNARLLRTRKLDVGFWFAEDLREARPTQTVRTLIERSAWKLALNRGRRLDIIEFGSEGMSLRRDLKGLFQSSAHGPLLEHLDFLERRESEVIATTTSRLMELRRERPSADLVQIAGHRKQQIGLEIEYKHAEFKTKLIRVLKSNWTELI